MSALAVRQRGFTRNATSKALVVLLLLEAALALITVAASADDSTAPPADLERQLLRQAPHIMEQLRAKGYQNIGVLKFRVKKGDKPATDRAGTLNLDLARQLELALILADSAEHPLGIIHDASGTAASIPGANHLTADGRAKLFTGQYPLAWGQQRVKPDAFLTGIVELSGDLRATTVAILCFDARGGQDELARLKGPSSVEELSEAGESFMVRGVFDGGSTQLSEQQRDERAETEAIQQVAMIRESEPQIVAAKARTLPAVHPLSPTNTEAPVSLVVYYDGNPVPYEFRDGCAAIAEPNQGQRVSFVLKRKAPGDQRYGVVLKVNGESTIARQRLADDQCRMWIIEPKGQPITVRGYQIDGQTAEEFRVLSPAESKAREMDYGADVGTISLVVFRERPAGEAAKQSAPLLDEDWDLAILHREEFPAKPAADFKDLRQELSNQLAVADATRGLIAEGDTIQNRTQKVSFVVDPIPVMSGVITYYHR